MSENTVPDGFELAGVQDALKEWGEPLDEQVLVRPVRMARTKEGIELPYTAKELTPMVQVVAVGAGRLTLDGVRVPLAVKPGDLVLLRDNAGAETQVNGEPMAVVQANNVILRYHNVDMTLRKVGATPEERERAAVEAAAEKQRRIVTPTAPVC